MTIKELCKKVHRIALSKGFWDDINRNRSELLMLCVTELAEACEALRHDNPKSDHIPNFSLVEEELADVIIRIGDMAYACGYRLEEAIKAKIKFNKTRAIRHGKKF